MLPKTAEERRWQAESDARSLIEAEAVKMDPKRNKRAKIAANRIAIEKKKEAAAAQRIAKKRSIHKSSKNSGIKHKVTKKAARVTKKK